MKFPKNLDSTIKRILKEVITENMTPNQQAAMDAGYGPVSTQYADQLVNSGQVKVGSLATGVVKGVDTLKQTPQPTQPVQKQVTPTSKFGVDYKYNYPGDKSYVYGYKDGKWYTKNVAKNVEFDLSTNPKWKSSIDNLNKQFAAQIKTPTPTPTPTVQLYQNQYQTQRDNTYVKPIVPPTLQK